MLSTWRDSEFVLPYPDKPSQSTRFCVDDLWVHFSASRPVDTLQREVNYLQQHRDRNDLGFTLQTTRHLLQLPHLKESLFGVPLWVILLCCCREYELSWSDHCTEYREPIRRVGPGDGLFGGLNFALISDRERNKIRMLACEIEQLVANTSTTDQRQCTQ